MNYLLANILLAMGVSATPFSANPPDYQLLGTTELYKVEIDMKSLKATSKIGGWQVRSTMKRTMINELVVPGKPKKGAYYVDTVTTRCAQDTVTIDTSTLYAKDGEVLVTSDVPVELPNMNVADSFVSVYIRIMCSNDKKLRPGTWV